MKLAEPVVATTSSASIPPSLAEQRDGATPAQSSEPFYKTVVIHPLHIRADYTVFGSDALTDATLHLSRLDLRGVSGSAALVAQAKEAYLAMITSEQVLSIAGGIPGVRPVKQVLGTAATMVTEPVKAYPRFVDAYHFESCKL